MSKRTRANFKPGDRALLLRRDGNGALGPVVIVSRYVPGELVSGHADWMARENPLVVLSLCGPLPCYKIIDGVVAFQLPSVMSLPVNGSRLIPLESDESGNEDAAIARATSKLTQVSADARALMGRA